MRKLFRFLIGLVMPDYASEVAEAIHRLADVGERIAGGLFAVAGGMKAKDVGDQRNMTAVFSADCDERYGDVWKRLTPEQKQQLDSFVQNICRAKK